MESTILPVFYSKFLISVHIYFSGNTDLDQVLQALLANNMFMGCFSALVLDNMIPGKHLTFVPIFGKKMV